MGRGRVRTGCRAAAATAVALALATSGAVALTDEEIFRDFRFNFINPGGRSLGLGGAFISLADDATAAQANPAGLTTLLSPQLFLEVRFAGSATRTTTREFRDPLLPEEGFDIRVRTDTDSSVSPSFASYVLPRNRFSVGFSRQEVLDLRNRTSSSYTFLSEDGSDVRTGTGDIEARLVHWNVGLGFRAHERFRVGVTLSLATLEMQSSIVNLYTDPTGNLIGDPGLAGVPFEMYRTAIDDRDTDLVFSAGLLWQVTDTFSIGAVYRQGADFEVDETLTARPIDVDLVPGMISSRVFFNETDTILIPGNDTFTFPNEFHVPDVAGLGLSWRVIPNLTLALDANRIRYSNLLDGFNSRLNVLTVGFTEESEARFTLDDQTNLHFGAEYAVGNTGGRRILVRAGFHQDKDNRLRSDFPGNGFGLGSNDNFPGRSDENHYAVGLGMVLGNHFQLDLALDHATTSTEGVASLIYKF